MPHATAVEGLYAERLALRPVIFRSWQPGESSSVVAVTALVDLTSALVVGLLCLHLV